MSFSEVLKKLDSNHDLDNDDLSIIFQNFKEEKLNDEDIKNLVIKWRKKGETPYELKTLADLIFKLAPQISLKPPAPTGRGSLNEVERQGSSLKSNIVDVCGTGGDKAGTFNISTLSAIVASGCGVPVIKHSGRSTTSISGSVDVLNQFGVNFDLPNKLTEECFLKSNLMFVSSKELRRIFGVVKKVCKELDMPGFVNLLGPLVNPYQTDLHLMGVSNKKWGDVLSSTLKLQGKKEAIVVCSEIKKDKIYLDELSLSGMNYFWHLKDGIIAQGQVSPDDYDEEEIKLENLVIKDISESKTVFKKILKGELDSDIEPKAKTVALNAGGVLYLQKKVKSMQDGYYVALKAIKSGEIWEHFQKFLNCNKMSLE